MTKMATTAARPRRKERKATLRWVTSKEEPTLLSRRSVQLLFWRN